MSIDRGMDKENMVHLYNGILLSHKMNEIGSFVQMWMDLESVMQSEVSQTEKDEYHISYTWNLKKRVQMNLFTKQKQSHRCKKQTYGYQAGKGGGGDNLGDWD